MNSHDKKPEDKFRAAWARLEETQPQPQFFKSTCIREYEEFASFILQADDDFVDEVTTTLYAGHTYVLRNAFDKTGFRNLVQRLHDFSQTEEPSFHKMLDGIPNYHRVIDNTNTLKYAVTAMRRGFYFFRWNEDPVDAFDLISENWKTFKVLSGLRPDEFEANMPLDGVIDRLIFYHYPRGGGQLKNHVDPTNNNKIVMGAMMSEQGRDFESGGFFGINADGERESLENDLELGDALILYPTVEHGVDPVDEDNDTVWQTTDGRWFMGLSSVDSDHVEDRITAGRRE